MSRVLLAIDGSDFALRACQRALELIGRDHEFLALSVVRLALVATPASSLPEALPGSLEMVEDAEPNPAAPLLQADRVESEAASDIEAALRHLHVTAREIVEVGEPGAVICRVATDERVDAIVIGTHGRGLAHRLLGGSVSQHVLQHAPCLVIVHGRDAR